MDYNWLLTTIAQSSAALVGISIGLIILRISVFMNYKLSFSEQLLINYFKSLERFESLVQSDPRFFEKDGMIKILKETSKAVEVIEGYTKPEFPYSIWIGLVGILWILIFGLIKPINQLSEFTINYSNIQHTKNYFFFGLIILALYLIIEVEIVAFSNFNRKVKNKIIKILKPKKDKPKEN